MQVFSFFVLDSGSNVSFEAFDDLEALVETCNGTDDAAVGPHHVLEHLLAFAPVSGLGKADGFFL